jgi:hypothetical protein
MMKPLTATTPAAPRRKSPLPENYSDQCTTPVLLSIFYQGR